MRIALFHNQPPGGARRSLVELGRRLSERHEVTVYTLAATASPQAEAVDPFASFARAVHRFPVTVRGQTPMGFYWNDLRKWQDISGFDEQARGVARAMEQGGHDVAWVDGDQSIGAPFVLRYLQMANLYYCHEPPRRFVEAMCRPQALPLSRWERARLVWRWPTMRWLDGRMQREERRNVRAAQRVLTNSRYNQGRIRDYYGRGAELCYLGVDSCFFTPGEELAAANGKAARPDTLKPEVLTPEVLTVGALEPHKGFEFLIGAVSRCRTRPRLRIVGGGGHPRMKGHLLSLAEGLGVELVIESGLNDVALRARYWGASLFAFAPHFEPFGLVTLEAMACGKAVVAINEGGQPEIVEAGKTGLLLPRDEGRWAAAIDTLLADDEQQRRFGEAGRCAVTQRWSWEQAAATLEGHLLAAAGG